MYTNFPSTRYQGSKRRILEWIEECMNDIEFETALDVFGGTGSVSYLMKAMGKEVTFNDFLLCNTTSARALVRNSTIKLSKQWLKKVRDADPYRGVVTDKYGGIFFTEEENAEIDKIAYCIFFNPDTKLEGAKRDIALHILSQSLLMKRPFNLFHRANLEIRLKDCDRQFGNKITWEKPIFELMEKNLNEVNDAIFSNGKRHHVYRRDALDIKSGYDLIYIDPPYCNANGLCVDYQNYYSFLDGLCDYVNWKERIDVSKKNFPLQTKKYSFMHSSFKLDLERLLSIHSDSVIVMSYKTPGQPTIDELKKIFERTHLTPVCNCKKFSYALNRNNGGCKENLLVAMPKK